MKENDKGFGSFKAESFELMKSELSSKGPKYDIVKSFPL
jgi:2'-5' RNA ligase